MDRGWRGRCWMGLLVVAACCGCADDPAPFIEITELAPSMVVPGDDEADDVRIRLHYVDSDGDLGGGIATMYDCRTDALTTELIIPAVASDAVVEQGIEIDGELLLFLTDLTVVARQQSTQCTSFGAAPLPLGRLGYCMQVSDDAGNLSNPACSDTVTIIQP